MYISDWKTYVKIMTMFPVFIISVTTLPKTSYDDVTSWHWYQLLSAVEDYQKCHDLKPYKCVLFLEVRSPNRLNKSKIMASAQLCSLQSVWGESPLPAPVLPTFLCPLTRFKPAALSCKLPLQLPSVAPCTYKRTSR